jgi:nitrile hydratase accessory protein
MTRAAPVADRRRIEDLVAQLPAGERSFEQPWELRAFALAVAAHEGGSYAWPQFQQALVESIARWESAPAGQRPWSYYEHWVTALERVLSGQGVLDSAALDDATHGVLATPANANHHEAHREPVAIDPAR